jgi:ribonuclease HI
MERKRNAERQVEGWIIAKGMKPIGMEQKMILATDGSMKPGNVKMGEERTVTAACINRDGKEVGAMVEDNSAVVMHGELLGVIMALIQARLEEPKEVLILTDYLNVVKRIQEFRENGQMAESSWYRWIYGLWREIENTGLRIKIQHVRAHADIETASTHELLNHHADQMANKARKSRTLNRLAWPTFEMQNYVIWSSSNDSYIEMDTYRCITLSRRKRRVDNIKIRYPTRFDLTCYEQNDTSEAYYTKSLKDYSIRVQVLSRAKALMTNLETERMFPGKAEPWGPMCPHCTTKAESDHHVFVVCERYKQERDSCIERLQKRINDWSNKHGPHESLNNLAVELFSDTVLWPGNRSEYYRGLIPRLDIPTNADHESRTKRSNLVKMIHLELVKSAGYIWSLRMKAQFNIPSPAIPDETNVPWDY